MNLGRKLKQRRLELNMTLEEVGNIVGVSKSTVMKWETGDIANMRRDKIALLAKALKVSPLFIMGMDEENKKDANQLTSELTEGDILTLAAHKAGHEGALTKEEFEKIKLAIKIALAKNND